MHSLNHLAPPVPDAVGSAALRRLRARFDGVLLAPADAGYEPARRTWNGAIDRRPALIARCASTADVQAAVRFAREQGLALTVRGGGHSVVGHGVGEGALLIDLAPLSAVAVDPAARVARAGGGARVGALDAATQAHGLAATLGMVSHVGLGGLTLGGGFGHLMRRQGLTVDHLRAVQLVTAEGERRRVDARTDPELLWGLRGGGGNFGIAAALEYELHPVGPHVLGGPLLWPLERAGDVLRGLRDLVPSAPDELGLSLVAMLAPPAPFVAPEHVGRPAVGAIVSWTGAPDAGVRPLAALRGLAPPLVDAVRPLPYVALQSLFDASAVGGNHAYWRSHRLPALSDAVIDLVVGLAGSFTSPLSLLNGWVLGGAASRVAPDATAVGPRPAGFELRIIANWPAGDRDERRHVDWVRAGWEALRPHAAGVYATFLADEGPSGVRAAYGERLARLRALKGRMDPDNVFFSNQNIPPSPGGFS